MKKLFIILAFGSTIQAALQQSHSPSPLATTLALEIISSRQTPDQAVIALREFIQNNPEARDLLNNPSTQQKVAMALIKKIFNTTQEPPYTIESTIDSLEIPALSQWVRENFNYFIVLDILGRRTFVLLGKKNPTVGDLLQATAEQTGRSGFVTTIEDEITPLIVLNHEDVSTPLSALRIPKGAQFIIKTTSIENIIDLEPSRCLS